MPLPSAVAVMLEAPLRFTVAPAPPTPLIVPEMLYVATVAPKFTPVTLAELTVTTWLTGLKAKPLAEGVTVYEPFSSPANA